MGQPDDVDIDEHSVCPNAVTARPWRPQPAARWVHNRSKTRSPFFYRAESGEAAAGQAAHGEHLSRRPHEPQYPNEPAAPSRCAAMKPRVICHMLSSLDARVDLSTWSDPAQDSRDDQVALYFELYRSFGARGYLVGRITMQPYATAEARDPQPGDRARRPAFVGPEAGRSLAVVLDPHGKLHWGSGVLDDDHLVMVLGPGVPDRHLCELAERGVSYLIADTADIEPGWVLDALAQHFGAQTVVVEGGGIVNGLFLRAGLVDEISLLMVPAIGGRTGARNIVECGEEGLKGRVQLSFLNAQVLRSGTVHLRYSVQNLQPSEETA